MTFFPFQKVKIYKCAYIFIGEWDAPRLFYRTANKGIGLQCIACRNTHHFGFLPYKSPYSVRKTLLSFTLCWCYLLHSNYIQHYLACELFVSVDLPFSYIPFSQRIQNKGKGKIDRETVLLMERTRSELSPSSIHGNHLSQNKLSIALSFHWFVSQ